MESFKKVVPVSHYMFFIFLVLWLLGFFDLNGLFFSHLLELWQSFVTELIRNGVSFILYNSKEYMKSIFGFFLLGSLSTMYILSHFNAISFIILGFILGILSKDLGGHVEKKIPNNINVTVTANEDSYCPLDMPPNLEFISAQSNLDFLDFWYVFF